MGLGLSGAYAGDALLQLLAANEFKKRQDQEFAMRQQEFELRKQAAAQQAAEHAAVMQRNQQLDARNAAMQNLELLSGQPARSLPGEDAKNLNPEAVQVGLDAPMMPTIGFQPGQLAGKPGVLPIARKIAPVTIPGFAGQPSVDVTPSTAEDVLKAKDEARRLDLRQKQTEKMLEPYTLGEGQERFVGGTQIAAGPAKQPTASGGSDYARFLGRYAAGKGKTVEQLTAADELGARQQYNAAGRAPASSGGGGSLAAANGALTPEGVDYAATQYRVTGAMPALGMGNAQARAAIINQAANQAKTLGQSPVASIQRQAAYKADAGALNKMRTMASAAESFEAKALQQADLIDQISAKVPRTQIPLINQALLSGQKSIAGDTNTQLLFNAITTFTSEYSKIMEGSTGSVQAATDSARKVAAELIYPALNKGTLSATLALMKKEMRFTIDGYGATIDHITNRMGGAAPLPAAIAAPSAKDPLGIR